LLSRVENEIVIWSQFWDWIARARVWREFGGAWREGSVVKAFARRDEMLVRSPDEI